MANRPRVMEHDFAGIVVDANGTEFKEGDNVFGYVEPGELSSLLLQFFIHRLIVFVQKASLPKLSKALCRSTCGFRSTT